MNIQLYNTASRTKETLVPITEGHISMYHCGPTVYWTQHIGNMRAVVMADSIVRTLRYLGYEVTLVRNYTDVGHLSGDNAGDADTGEDRMEKGAKREGVSPAQIAEKYIGIYERDIASLNVVPADVKPKATEHIREIIDMVHTLVDKGYAYATDLAIYFDTTKATDYHRLSGQKAEDNIHGAGAGTVADQNKKNPADFALWFFKAGTHAYALQYWPSPFISSLCERGEGFPGWHIECSAMIKKYLGPTIDIHMGGIEHVPVHHTNEIAQSESANDAPFAHFWLHNEHLLVNGAKMSKSEGTAFSVSEVKEKGFDPLALRYFFLQAHYRSKQNFTWDALQAAQNGLTSLYRQVAALGGEVGVVQEVYTTSFRDALGDDFNTPRALAVLSDIFRSDLSNGDKRATIIDCDRVLGLRIEERAALLSVVEDIPAEVQALVAQRTMARSARDFAMSDSLRDQISALGYDVLDTEQGTEVRRK